MEKAHTRRFVTVFLIISVILITVICRVLSWNEMRIKRIDVDGVQFGTVDKGINYHVDNLYYNVDSTGKKTIHAEGWCVLEKHPTNMIALRALIRNNKTNVYYELPTTIVTRTDVTESLNDGINYDYSGFLVDVKCNSLDIEKDSYTLFLLYEIEGEVYLVTTDSNLELNENE